MATVVIPTANLDLVLQTPDDLLAWIATLSLPAQSIAARYSPSPVCIHVVARESASTTPIVTFEFGSPGRG